jgi:hypothetical protein
MAKYEGDIANKEVSFVRWQAPFIAATRVVHPHLYNFELAGRFLFATAPPSDDGFDEKNLCVSTDLGRTFGDTVFPSTVRGPLRRAGGRGSARR